MGASPFHGAAPTEAEIKLLLDTFGTPTVNEVITHDVIAKAARVAMRSFRYRTVVNAWRGKLYREQNVEMLSVRGIGYKRADGEARVAEKVSRTKSHLRGVRRQGERAARIPNTELNEEQRKLRDHVVAGAVALRQFAATQAREFSAGNALGSISDKKA